MIKSIEIENVQSHKKSKLDFVPGVNVIIGLSDSGKSAIMRAFKLCLKNQPTGEDYRSWWGGDTTVHINFDNGQVSRIRKKGFNGYVLGMHDEFVALKTDVPEEIQRFINMDETNMQFQLDPFFLLSKSPGEVAKYFNKVAKLDQIDTAIANINSWVTKLNQDIKYKEGDLQEKLAKVEQYAGLDKLEIDVENLEALETALLSKQRSRKTISNLLGKIAEIDAEIEAEQYLISLEPKVEAILEKQKLKEALEYQHEWIQRLLENIQEIDEALEASQTLIQTEPKIDALIGLYKTLQDKQTERNMLLKTIKAYQTNQIALDNDIRKVAELEKRWHENMPEVCPLCEK